MSLSTFGTSDCGEPLRVAVISSDKTFTPQSARKAGKLVLFINNAIHPGEPEGVDASMLFVRDLVINPKNTVFLKNIVVIIIPFYNVDGVLNRYATSRVNQNGPSAYGFRGNAQNLDLNRDFVKCDTRNAMNFNQLFTKWQPDIFIDNHTSNGSDYQYTMTCIATQQSKLAPQLADYQQNSLLPQLYAAMKAVNFEMTPYVNFDENPANGIIGFMDAPRYSTGYAALHHVIGFMPETHMLKPFPARVRGTLAFEQAIFKICFDDKNKIIAAKQAAVDFYKKEKKRFELNWKLDTTQRKSLIFKGYEAKMKPSEVSGLPRLWYDRNAPFEKKVPYFNFFTPSVFSEKPTAYIVPQAYQKVIERLRWNGVSMRALAADTLVEVQLYRIKNFKSSANPYEGHHPNNSVELSTETQKLQYKKGDFWITLNQNANRYIIETLEPQGMDSFFSWNFFDGILNQKEGYSDYVFEDIAADMLKSSPELRQKLEDKRKNDPKFATDAAAQLDFVYKNSVYYEPTHQLYPVGRVF
ncbi:MAG: M14 family zinc carboxypeptidase [Saprospiraceae bacterium]|nr:M14 family zinc carboxypeptidase [Saprospiraceae bacterium]